MQNQNPILIQVENRTTEYMSQVEILVKSGVTKDSYYLQEPTTTTKLIISVFYFIQKKKGRYRSFW